MYENTTTFFGRCAKSADDYENKGVEVRPGKSEPIAVACDSRDPRACDLAWFLTQRREGLSSAPSYSPVVYYLMLVKRNRLTKTRRGIPRCARVTAPAT